MASPASGKKKFPKTKGVKEAYEMLSIANLLDNPIIQEALVVQGYKIKEGVIHLLRADAVMILVKDTQKNIGWASHSILNPESSI